MSGVLDIVIDGNGQSIWGVNQAFLHGIAQGRQSRWLDVVWEENPDLRPDHEPAAIYPVTHRFRGMNYYRRLGKDVLTAYKDEEELAFNLTFCGHSGINNHWGYAEPGRKPLRSPQPGVAELLAHFKRHCLLYTTARPAGRVAIWRSTLSLAFISTDTHLSACVMEHLLFLNRIPFSIVDDEAIHEKSLAAFDLVILPDTEYLSDEQVGALTRYVEKGGSLLITEQSGLYTDRGRKRIQFAFKGLFKQRVQGSRQMSHESANFDPHRQFSSAMVDGFFDCAVHGRGRVAYLPRISYIHKPRVFKSHYNVHYDGIDSRYWKEPRNHREILDVIEWLHPGCQPVRAFGYPEMFLEYVRWDDGQSGVMLLHCGDLKGPARIPFTVCSRGQPRNARVLVPERRRPLPVNWEKREGAFATVLPGMMRHAMVIWQHE